MNSMEGSQKIPTYVEYKNALVYGSRSAVRTYLKYESDSPPPPAGTDDTVTIKLRIGVSEWLNKQRITLYKEWSIDWMQLSAIPQQCDMPV